MRKKMIAIAALLLTVALIAACGRANETSPQHSATSAEESAPSSSAPAKSSPAAAEEQPAERTVATVNGDVTIPAEPQRIAATYYAGELAALGIRPAGTVTRLLGEASPNLAAYMEGSADIGNFPPSLEAIAALEPDLILATDFDGIEYADYAKIAPTIVLPWSNDDVWTKLRTIAGLLGKEAEAELFISGYESQAAAAREKIQGAIGADETVSIIRFFGSSIRVYGGRDIGHAFYNGLRLAPPPTIAAAMAQDPNFTSTENVTLEELPDYAGDRIFVVVTDEDGDKAYKEAQKLALWSALPAVANGFVYELPANKWFAYDPISVQATLQEAVDFLTAGKRE
ncbi:ABC transporter substrate-binding protein [Cohnella cellulosilytica]|uniref:ABC transporter substrate-binding protein n=1 Tax=Cohnella cellulosilytica TaxID=986710 RepID=A0ABW2FME0_9BACL